ncbi:MAG: family 16 glycosylhydrolase [Chloroflexi bacterium]|nr:family 16 glycosylhydrolase [Chloroflexota bacterium]
MTVLSDRFEGGAAPYWNRFAVGRAWVVEQANSLNLVVGPAPAGSLSDAELNDHRLYERGHWVWRPPLRLTVRARASHGSGALKGTAGFGFWNSPFAGDGSAADSPQAVWFFYASPESHMTLSADGHGSGWRAQVLNAPSVPRWTVVIANQLWRISPLRSLLFRAAQAQVGGGEGIIASRFDEWHTYRLDWLRARVVFFVDGQPIFRAASSPRGPLGFVAWMDNSVLSLRAGGMASGNTAVMEHQWLELSEVTIEPLSSDA